MPQVKLKSRGGGGASPDSDAATPLQGVVPPFENGIFSFASALTFSYLWL